MRLLPRSAAHRFTSLRSATLPLLCALAAACAPDFGGLGEETYAVRGRVAPEYPGDVLPASSAIAIEIFDAWEDDLDPFRVGASVLARPPLAGDGSFDAEVTEGSGGAIAGVLVDDAAGAPDRLVATINDRRVIAGVADLTALALDRVHLDRWRASPALAGRDPEAEGAALITFLDVEGRPAAGVTVEPAALALGDVPPVIHYLDEAGDAVVDGATTTSASGRVLILGLRAFTIAGTPAGGVAGEYETFGCGTRPGAIFVETVSRRPPLPEVTYLVSGRVVPAFAGDPLPPTEVTIFDAWENEGAPFPLDATVFAGPMPVVDARFEAEVTESGYAAHLPGIVIDDAPGRAGPLDDVLVRTISDADVRDGVAETDAPALARARLAAWERSPLLAGHDLAAEGAALITFLDASGRPMAGVHPYAFDASSVFFLSDDGWSIDAAAVATGASGRVLVLAPSLIFGFDGPTDAEGVVDTHAAFIGGQPGAIFVESIRPIVR